MDQYGTVDQHGEHATLRFERFLQHSPERVWRALTDPAELRAWYLADAKIDGRSGGSVEMVSGPARFHWTGRILAWQPHSLFEYEFNAEPHPHLPRGEQTVVRYELVAQDGGTLLKLQHTNLTTPTALGFAPGTHVLLDRLAAQLDGIEPPNWNRRYDEVKSGYPAWTEPLGANRRA